MGFNKRFVKKEDIINSDDQRIKVLFNADALIFVDSWSSEFYKLYLEGYKREEIFNKLIES
jgi:hypothetical protein